MCVVPLWIKALAVVGGGVVVAVVVLFVGALINARYFDNVAIRRD